MGSCLPNHSFENASMSFNSSNGFWSLQRRMGDLHSMGTHILGQDSAVVQSAVALHGAGMASPSDPSPLDSLQTFGASWGSRTFSNNFGQLETRAEAHQVQNLILGFRVRVPLTLKTLKAKPQTHNLPLLNPKRFVATHMGCSPHPGLNDPITLNPEA